MPIEHLPSGGESPQDRFAYQRYLDDVARGKGLLQLTAVAREVTPWIHQSWSPRTFTPVLTPEGNFDEVICNVAYHFHRHGANNGFASVAMMTMAARNYFRANRGNAKPQPDGTLLLSLGRFEMDGRIITFYPERASSS